VEQLHARGTRRSLITVDRQALRRAGEVRRRWARGGPEGLRAACQTRSVALEPDEEPFIAVHGLHDDVPPDRGLAGLTGEAVLGWRQQLRVPDGQLPGVGAGRAALVAVVVSDERDQ
jgi:hypothetical protein